MPSIYMINMDFKIPAGLKGEETTKFDHFGERLRFLIIGYRELLNLDGEWHLWNFMEQEWAMSAGFMRLFSQTSVDFLINSYARRPFYLVRNEIFVVHLDFLSFGFVLSLSSLLSIFLRRLMFSPLAVTTSARSKSRLYELTLSSYLSCNLNSRFDERHPL